MSRIKRRSERSMTMSGFALLVFFPFAALASASSDEDAV